MWKCIHIVIVGHIKHAEQAWRGWYTAALLLPLGMLKSVAFPPLKTEEKPLHANVQKCVCTHKHIHMPNKLPLSCRCFCV